MTAANIIIPYYCHVIKTIRDRQSLRDWDDIEMVIVSLVAVFVQELWWSKGFVRGFLAVTAGCCEGMMKKDHEQMPATTLLEPLLLLKSYYH